MGTLTYGDGHYVVEIDDRALAHLKVVILAKLRRSESFSFSWATPAEDFSWATPAEDGSGRHTLWLHPSIPLRFDFLGNRPPALNRAWIAQMLSASGQNGDLTIGEEPDESRVSNLGGRNARW